ncbi:MAG: OadG family protein [bacterium]|nr:OadG family protein [bacterium]
MNINLLALEDGLVVLCVGFFVVFMFLTVLIGAMFIMGKIVAYLNKLFPVMVPAAGPVKSVSTGADEEIAVAIAAALLRQNH